MELKKDDLLDFPLMTYYSLALYLYVQPLPAGIPQTSRLNSSKLHSLLLLPTLACIPCSILETSTQTTYEEPASPSLHTCNSHLPLKVKVSDILSLNANCHFLGEGIRIILV